MNIPLDQLLALATPRSRHWLSDAIANDEDPSEAADDFVAENGKGSHHLANQILVAMGREPVFST